MQGTAMPSLCVRLTLYYRRCKLVRGTDLLSVRAVAEEEPAKQQARTVQL